MKKETSLNWISLTESACTMMCFIHLHAGSQLGQTSLCNVNTKWLPLPLLHQSLISKSPVCFLNCRSLWWRKYRSPWKFPMNPQWWDTSCLTMLDKRGFAKIFWARPSQTVAFLWLGHIPERQSQSTTTACRVGLDLTATATALQGSLGQTTTT